MEGQREAGGAYCALTQLSEGRGEWGLTPPQCLSMPPLSTAGPSEGSHVTPTLPTPPPLFGPLSSLNTPPLLLMTIYSHMHYAAYSGGGKLN